MVSIKYSIDNWDLVFFAQPEGVGTIYENGVQKDDINFLIFQFGLDEPFVIYPSSNVLKNRKIDIWDIFQDYICNARSGISFLTVFIITCVIIIHDTHLMTSER